MTGSRKKTLIHKLVKASIALRELYCSMVTKR